MTKEDEMVTELKNIVTLLTPKPAPPPPEGFADEFKQFLMKYKVLGLAVAFILGVYLGALVQAMVTDLIMPIIEMVLPQDVNWEDYVLGPFRIGHFFGERFVFIIVAFVIFLLVKYSKRLGLQ
jgi:large conductance mechanosensitive channel protein